MLKKSHILLVAYVGCSKIQLFEYVFHFCLEFAKNGALEVVAIEFQPILHLIGRERIVVNRLVEIGISVQSCTSCRLNKRRVLRTLTDFRRCHREFVYLFCQLVSFGFVFFRVFQFCLFVIELDNLLVHRLFLRPVESTYFLRTLEQHVFEIVSQTRKICRFVDRTCSYGNLSVNIGYIFINPQIYLHTVL